MKKKLVLVAHALFALFGAIMLVLTTASFVRGVVVSFDVYPSGYSQKTVRFNMADSGLSIQLGGSDGMRVATEPSGFYFGTYSVPAYPYARYSQPMPGYEIYGEIEAFGYSGLGFQYAGITINTNRVGVKFWTASRSIVVPMPLLAILGLPSAWVIFKRLRKFLGKGPGYCETCGYDLRATPHQCPECGAKPGEDLVRAVPVMLGSQ